MTDLLVTPLDRFIREQQDLTAVERFSLRHDGGGFDAGPDARARGYRDLLPATGPGPGEQYGFEVDLDACSGCKACVSACHSLNGLADDEMWRSVGLLHSDGPVPQQQTVTTACHHCVDPACLNGCPVDAYEKDPITGIVAHLDDQCIGCSYCTLMCPYEVPVYDHDRGIVRKCDMCSDRLAEGEAPACVQGCPTEAISISIVTVADLLAETRPMIDAPSSTLVPSAPSSAITVPTTRYRSAEPLPADLVAADRYSLQPSHGHTPLAVMLVLTQAAVGAFVLALALGDRLGPADDWIATVTLLVGVIAIGASVLHLGRPLLAWRAVLGLRHSWLSREIVAFGMFAAAATAAAASTWLGLSTGTTSALDGVVAVTGVAGVLCSVQVYAVTRRRWWSFPRTLARFTIGSLAGGASLLIALVVLLAAITDADSLSSVMVSAVRPLAVVVVGATIAGLVLEASALVPATWRGQVELERSARLLGGDLRRRFVGRLMVGFGGGVILALVLIGNAPSDAPSMALMGIVAVVSLAAVVGGLLVERRIFFLAVSTPRMPGVLR